MDTLDRIAPHAHWLLRFSLASVFVIVGNRYRNTFVPIQTEAARRGEKV